MASSVNCTDRVAGVRLKRRGVEGRWCLRYVLLAQAKQIGQTQCRDKPVQQRRPDTYAPRPFTFPFRATVGSHRLCFT